MKKIIKKTITSDILYDLEGDLDNVIHYLQSLKETYSEYSRFEIEVDYDYDNSKSLLLHGFREENEEEYKERLFHEGRQKERLKKINKEKEVKERKEYERLKKKFEK